MPANPAMEAAAVTDVDSAAAELERRFSATEEPPEPVEELEEPEAIEASGEESDEQETIEEVTEEFQFKSVDELAEALEIPLDEFLSKIKGKVKINGEESEITLSELRDGYQREADYRRKTMELAEQRREAETAIKSQREHMEQQLEMTAQVANFYESQFLRDFQGVDWARLRVENPAEYSALATDYQTRQAQLQQMRYQAAQMWQVTQQQRAEENRLTHQNRVKKEFETLMDTIPEWRDKEAYQKASKDIRDVLTEYGYEKDEIDTLYDHRHMKILKDLIKLRGTKDVKTEQAEIAKKKVKDLPKVLKPGKPSPDAKRKAATDKLARFKKSGKVDDLAALLASRM